jgi:Spy/CpxP family protein refolding chaperone
LIHSWTGSVARYSNRSIKSGSVAMILRLGKLAVVFGVVLLLTSTAAAQRFGPFGGGGGKAMLLMNPDVQQELKLSEDQIAKVKEISQSVFEKNKEIFAKLKDTPKDQLREKFTEIAKAIGEETDKAMKDLLKPEQTKRMRQLELQQRGYEAFTDAEVQKDLKLDDDQKEKIKILTDDARKDVGELFQGAKGNFQEAMTKIQALRKDTLEKVMATLKEDQKKAWTALTGEPFEFKFRRPGT